MNIQVFNILTVNDHKWIVTVCSVLILTLFTWAQVSVAQSNYSYINDDKLCKSINDTDKECCGNGVLDPGEICDIGLGKNGVDVIHQGQDVNGAVSGDGRPDYGCNATCSEVNSGWKCNGYNSDVNKMKADYEYLYNYMVALYQDIESFSKDDANFSNEPNSCKTRSINELCADYETKLEIFIAANRHQPISCLTQKSLTKPLMTKLRYREGFINSIKVNFKSDCK